jgi:peptide deformylase
MTKIVLDNEFDGVLAKPCEDVSVEEGEKIAIALFNKLTEEEDGVGLAANQIGLSKNVCVINVKEPIYFINPKIIEQTGELFYTESCLSYPGKVVKTKRSSTIIIEADNFKAPVAFTSLGGQEIDILETVAIQHELAHLRGETMWDYEYKQTPVVSTKIGRNEKVTITKGTETKELKWKKAEALVASGDWELV